MANCTHCGKWAGVMSEAHLDCLEMARSGMTQEEIRAKIEKESPPVARPLTAAKIFWVIFGALWAFSLTAGLLAWIIRQAVS